MTALRIVAEWFVFVLGAAGVLYGAWLILGEGDLRSGGAVFLAGLIIAMSEMLRWRDGP